jgi:hypothetical protein
MNSESITHLHDRLCIKSIETTYVFTDDTDSSDIFDVTVIWSVVTGTGSLQDPTARYKVAVRGLNGRKRKYSLLTLGIQSVDWETEITGWTLENGAGQIGICDLGGNARPLRLDKIGKRFDASARRDMPIGTNIWFAKFDGVTGAEFDVVEGNQPKCGLAIWSGFPLVGHDNDPPRNPPE